MNRREFVKSGVAIVASDNLLRGLRPLRAALPQAPIDAGHSAVQKILYEYDLLKWLYIGWEGDHPKTWTFMGGGVAPGLGPVIQYTVTIDGTTYFPDEFAPDRKSHIKWHLRGGYLPCPVSQWNVRDIGVEIQHFANRILADRATAVYSRVRLTNLTAGHVQIRLNVNAGPESEVPLTGEPTGYTPASMCFDIPLGPHEEANIDFVAFAAGNAVQSSDLKSAGSFDSNYDSMSSYWQGRMAALAEPLSLPVPGMVDMYKSIQIMIWENMVRNGSDYEIHAAPHNPFNSANYDQTFSHDAPNYIDQYIREGDFEIAKRMLNSTYFKNSDSGIFKGLKAMDPVYEDTLGKYLLPFAEYLRCTGDREYFTPAVCQDLKRATRVIHAARNFEDADHYGLMKKSQDFENWADGGDYLLCDNWSALHGLQAYKYICEQLGDTQEQQWAASEINDLNECVNKAIHRTCAHRGIDYYLGAFDDVTLERFGDCDYSWVPYSGALSTFPWGAYLKGFDLGGVWKDKFDASIQHALEERDRKQIPQGSWGTWWGQDTYGTAYNCSAGLQCLYSNKYRTEVVKNLEFQLANQCAPYNWSEAFEFKGRGQWVGMYLPTTSYGNLDSWGASFTKQALLQACISVKTDGTVIIGRGIPDYWLSKNDVVEWANVNINNNRKISFRIIGGDSAIELRIWGDVRNGDVHFNLPIFKGNIAAADAGRIDNDEGVVILQPTTNSVVVSLRDQPRSKRNSNERVQGPKGRTELLYPNSDGAGNISAGSEPKLK